MPELPDIELYLYALTQRVVGQEVQAVRVASPFVVRSADPPISALAGERVSRLFRMGKRIVWQTEGGLYLVIHLMIAGRLQWRERGARVPAKVGLAAFDFPGGSLVMTEASTKKRASLHLVRTEGALAQFERGGLEPLGASAAAFREALVRENRTLKRALTDPRLFSGIGNAYSDEILFAAELSPAKLTRALTDEEVERLKRATQQTLTTWRDRLREQTGDAWPEKVTAFRPDMAVHGRYRQPCVRCGTPIQRVRYAENEMNYCPRCQTGGRLLADRALSRLLKQDWPRTLQELEDRALAKK